MPGAMKKFSEGHWEKDLKDVEVGGGRYSSEMNQEEEYRKSVDGLSNYVKKHKEKH